MLHERDYDGDLRRCDRLLITGSVQCVAAIGFVGCSASPWLDASSSVASSTADRRRFDRARAVTARRMQLRPVLMTCVVAGVGYCPAALSTGIGSQVQKPLAVGGRHGMMLEPLVILVTNRS